MYPVQILDGDVMRDGLCADLGFSVDDRLENVRRVAQVAKLLAKTQNIVLVALVTPLENIRSLVRAIVPSVIEVFVDAPLAICEERDPKGLYRKAREGALLDMTGLDSPFERPASPNIVCHTDRESIEESAAKVIEALVGEVAAKEPSQRISKPTIAVDFDGVIANYSGWKGGDVLGSPRSDVVAAMRILRTEGWKLIVHTTRSAEDIRSYLDGHSIPYDEINMNSEYGSLGVKPVATVYWDDRALRYSGDAMHDLLRIWSFRTWNGRE